MVLGGVLGWIAVSAGALLQSAPERRLLGGWLTASAEPWRSLGLHAQPRATLVGAVAGLVVLWLLVLWRRPPTGWAGRLGLAAWVAPWAVGPPMLSRDCYAYLAQGEVMRRGLDPYTHSTLALGHGSSVLAAVDRVWRGTIPPYGPLAMRIEHLVAGVGSGQPVLGLVALRVIVGAAVVATVVVVRGAVPQPRRQIATWLALSPVVLLQLLGAAHLDAVLCLLLVGAVVLHARGHEASATAVAVLACEIKVTAVVLLAVLLASAVRHRSWRAPVLSSLATASAGVLLLPSDPFGWVRGLRTPGSGWVPFTPSTSVVLLLRAIGLPGHRALVAVAVACGGLLLLLWIVCRHAVKGQRSTAEAAGWALLVVAVCGPALWPWYLAAPALLLLLDARRPRLMLLVLGGPPVLAGLPIGTVVAQRVTAVTELMALLLVVAVVLWRRRSPAPDPYPSDSSSRELVPSPS